MCNLRDSIRLVMQYLKFTFLPALALAVASCATPRLRPADAFPHVPPIVSHSADFRGYNQSLDTLLSQLLLDYRPDQLRGTLVWHGTKIRFDAGHDKLTLLDPSEFDAIEVIRKPEGGDQVSHLVRREGLGLPVVMMQKFRKEKSSPTKLFPLNGRHLPATLVAQPDRDGTWVLRFHHTRNVQRIQVSGKAQDLAYDLSTPLARSMAGSTNGHMALRGLFHSDRYLEDTGIYVPDVYDPGKIPVVFVHGIKSDPHIWQNAMNEVLRDPELRKKYQCWYFLYPTGLPIYASAAKLRRMLYLARNYYDPGHRSPQMSQMVLVGHSMGGILCRMQAIDSGRDIYDSSFIIPLEQLPVQQSSKRLIREVLTFDRVPFVRRVVFVATPHRGSLVAQGPLVRTMSILVHPTRNLDAVTLDVRLHAKHALHPKLLEFKNFGARSTHTLAPDHPLLDALQKRKIAIPYHTVIAATHPELNLANTTDG